MLIRHDEDWLLEAQAVGDQARAGIVSMNVGQNPCEAVYVMSPIVTSRPCEPHGEFGPACNVCEANDGPTSGHSGTRVLGVCAADAAMCNRAVSTTATMRNPLRK